METSRVLGLYIWSAERLEEHQQQCTLSLFLNHMSSLTSQAEQNLSRALRGRKIEQVS